MTRLLLSSTLIPNSTVEIAGDELHYLSRVRRHRKGDQVELRDGCGGVFDACILEIDRKRAKLQVAGRAAPRGEVAPVTLAVSVPKRNIMDDVVRMVSEIGAERLVPLVAERSDFTPSEEKLRRWRRIAEASLRQCGRRGPLQVSEAMPFEFYVEEADDSAVRLLLHPMGEKKLVDEVPRNAPIVLAVGPEGGFTDKELALAAERGFRAVSLDMPVLRIETAAVAGAVLAVALGHRIGTNDTDDV